mgnify:CR=1 FL=1
MFIYIRYKLYKSILQCPVYDVLQHQWHYHAHIYVISQTLKQLYVHLISNIIVDWLYMYIMKCVQIKQHYQSKPHHYSSLISLIASLQSTLVERRSRKKKLIRISTSLKAFSTIHPIIHTYTCILGTVPTYHQL